VRALRSIAGHALLTLAALALAGLLAEGVARIWLPTWRPGTAERARFWSPHPLYGWAHRPGTRGRFVGPGWDVEVRINSHGLRDVEHAYERTSSDRRRLLLLGDSFGWGFGVEQEETLTAVLGRLCPDWEFVNASVSGWGTDQEYLYYREEGRRYAPDAVVLLIYANDVLELSRDHMYGYPKPYFAVEEDRLVLRNVPVPERTPGQRLYTWLAAHSFVAHRLLAVTRIGVAIDVGGSTQLDLAVSERLLRRFARELRAEDVAFRWVLIPMEPALADVYRAVGRAEGVPVLDLAASFETARAHGETLTLPDNPHWNAAGHRLAARELAQALGCTPARKEADSKGRPTRSEP